MNQSKTDDARLDECAPKGSLTRVFLEYILELEPGEEVSSAQVAEGVNRDVGSSGVAYYLQRPVKLGLVAMRREGRIAFWRRGDGGNPSGNVRWPLADTEPDERTVTVTDAGMASSVFAYAAARGAAPFSVALATDGRLTIERNGRVVCELTDQERRKLIVAATQGVAAP